MLYRMFIYGTKAATGNAIAIVETNYAVVSKAERYWKGRDITKYMKPFDVEAVKARIERELGDKCQVYVDYPPEGYEQIPFLCVKTSFEEVRKLLPCLHVITTENDLVLYDMKTRKSFFRDLVDDTFITWKIREDEIRRKILVDDRPVFQYRKIASYKNENYKSSSFAVTLGFDEKCAPFEERTRQFYETLKDSLVKGEKLVCENRCFIVSGECYSITLCLEAYGKHSQMIGFYENFRPRVDLIRRMSCFEASKWIGQCKEFEKEKIKEFMNFIEMENKYKNPGDRFVRSVNIMKRHRKELFDIHYGVPGWYSSAVVFSVVPSKYCGNDDRISALILGEETASFILPFVNDVYPYIYERYYDADGNHLPAQMWQKIIENLLETEEMILHDTFNSRLDSYIEQLELYENSTEHDSEVWYKDRKKFLFEHRYDVAHLYDVFIKWSNLQILYHGDDCIFNISGP